jgi:hypothetical protein
MPATGNFPASSMETLFRRICFALEDECGVSVRTGEVQGSPYLLQAKLQMDPRAKPKSQPAR